MEIPKKKSQRIYINANRQNRSQYWIITIDWPNKREIFHFGNEIVISHQKFQFQHKYNKDTSMCSWSNRSAILRLVSTSWCKIQKKDGSLIKVVRIFGEKMYTHRDSQKCAVIKIRNYCQLSQKRAVSFNKGQQTN